MVMSLQFPWGGGGGEISWLSEGLLTSQEELCSMEFSKIRFLENLPNMSVYLED
jgi:hypothetical protein